MILKSQQTRELRFAGLLLRSGHDGGSGAVRLAIASENRSSTSIEGGAPMNQYGDEPVFHDRHVSPVRTEGPNFGIGLVSLILGIGSIPAACLCMFLGLPISVAAIVTGYIGRNREDRVMAIIGMILGAVSLLMILALAALVGGSIVFDEMQRKPWGR